MNGPVERFKEKLCQIFERHLSFHMLGYHSRAEHIPQVALLFMFVTCGPLLDVKVEDESGHGRSDLRAFEINGPRAVIMEFKQSAAKTPRGLKKLAEEALDQMEELTYRSCLREDKTQLREYGISFHKKKFHVEGKVFARERGGLWVESDA